MSSSELQTYVHLSKYSRYLDKENRRETWDETVDRLADFWESREAFDLSSVWESIRDKNIMPSMRSLMTAGKALERDHAAGYNCWAIAVNHPRVFDEIFYLLMCGGGVGFSVERQYINKLPEVAEVFHESDTTIKVRDSKIGWARSLKELVALLFSGDVPSWDLDSIRPAGSRLHTFGGRASGPEPLDSLLSFVVRVFRGAVGRKLTSIECHDLVCKIADTVIVGSVRRSALISLSNLTDDRMRRSKMGQWFVPNPERALANNSVAYTEKPDLTSFLKEFRSLYQSKSGERGIVNKVALKAKAESCGREHTGDYVLNPCMTGDTQLLTSEGYKPIGSLTGREVSVWNGERFSTVKPFSTGINSLVSVTLSDGSTLRCTPNHKFILKGNVRVNASDLIVGEKLMKFAMPVLDLETLDSKMNPYSQGFYAGDGCKNSKVSKLYFTKFCCGHRLHGDIVDYSSTYKNWKHGCMLPKDDVPISSSMSIKLNWLAGLIDSDGTSQLAGSSYQCSVSSIDRTFLLNVKLMLSTMGTQAKVVPMTQGGPKMLPNGRGGYKSYITQDCYRILISATDVWELLNLGLRTERVKLRGEEPNRDARRFVTVSEVRSLDYKEETFCATEPYNHSLTFNGIVTGNCGEAILRDTGGCCNLTEVVVRPGDSLDILCEKVRKATILGTLQSTLTEFRYLRKVWRNNAEEERLLGVSLTGLMDHKVLSGHKDLKLWLTTMKTVAKETNLEWSKKLGIPPSLQLTLIKPSGTVSQLCDTSSGIHSRHSPYYLRRVTQDLKDPLTKFMQEQGVPWVQKSEKIIFTFPIKSPKGSLMGQGPLAQLELWKVYYQYWCEGNPSQTINYSDQDFPSVQAWVWENWESIGGLAFFPQDDSVYDQEAQPFLEITKAEYTKALKEFPKGIRWEELRESEDNTTGSQEVACQGGACDV